MIARGAIIEYMKERIKQYTEDLENGKVQFEEKK